MLAFFGIADTSYLAQSEKSGTPLICDVKSLTGCNSVVSSPYSHIFGISLAELGLVFYIVLFVLVVAEVRYSNYALRRLIQLSSVVGFVAACYSLFTQLVILKAVCIYCMASVAISFLLLPCALSIESLRKKQGHRELTSE